VSRRFGAFATVGAAGFAIQAAAIVLLTRAGWSYVEATAAGVELAVLHNFVWHERWTWRDREKAPSLLGRLGRYHLSTGVTSIGGNVLLTAMFVELTHLPPVAANAAAVALMSLAHFQIADRWVFARHALLLTVLVGGTSAEAAGAELQAATAADWARYVMRFETNPGAKTRPPTVFGEPEGEAVPVSGGTIHRWKGATMIRGITVRQLVQALMVPGTPPPQEDVLEARVLARSGDSLRVYLKLVRTALITVTYDTEHEMTFSQLSEGLATSRSVATSIREAGGGDRGFLWRLNSYWRYVQTDAGVLVELESLSLSRTVPVLLRPVAGPIVNRIARESVTRTLESMKRHFERPTAK